MTVLKKMKKRFAVFVLLAGILSLLIFFSAISLLSSKAYADNPETYSTASPIIQVDYPGYNVSIIGYALASNSGAAFPLINTTSLDDKTTFNFTVTYIPNEYYNFTIVALDKFGSTKRSYKEFIIDHPGMNIYLIDPPVGIGNSPVYNITVGSAFNANCKYSLFMDPSCKTRSCMYDRAPYTFNETNDVVHKIIYYDASNTPPGGPFGQMYVICEALGNTDPTNEENFGDISFLVGYDNTNPKILSVDATQNPVVDAYNKKTQVNVVTDENTVCTISGGNSYNYTSAWFDGNNASEYSTYSKNHAITLDYTAIPNYISSSFDYTIDCLNYAQLHNSTSYSINYALNNTVVITQLTPKYVKSSSVNYEIATNIIVQSCNLAINNNPLVAMSDEGDHTHYNFSATGLNSGSNKMNVSCWIGYYANTQFDLIVDTTNPTLTISAGSKSCGLDSLSFKLLGVDTESGIDHYNYVIRDYNNTIVANRTTSSSSASFTASNHLAENTTYQITAYAYDKSGRVSNSATASITASDNSGPDCDTTPPDINIIIDRSNSYRTLVNVTCDDDTACANTFQEALVINGNSCNGANYLTKSYSADIPLSFSENGLLCIIGYDTNNNSVKKNKIITLNGNGNNNDNNTNTSNCINRVLDPGETDMDCGGNKCQSCGLSKSCTINPDCASNNCVNKTCTLNHCQNNATDEGETDKNCGGSCGPCDISKKCATNNDCINNNCENKTCTLNHCQNNATDEGETDIDCGGSCTTSCTTGKSCTVNADCSTNNCANNICVATSQKSSTGTILLLAGIILVLGGAGYIIYKSFSSKKQPEPQFAPFAKEYSEQPLSTQRVQDPHTEELQQQKLARKREVKGKERKSLMSGFENDNKEMKNVEGKTPESEDIKKIEKSQNKKTEDKTNAPSKPSEEYVDLDNLKKKDSADSKKDLFSKLGEIINTASNTRNTQNSENKNQPQAEEFSKTNAKTGTKKTESMEKSDTKKDVFKELSKMSKDYSSEDIAQKIAELSGKSSYKVSSVLDNKSISNDDALGLFNNLDRDKLVSDVFKKILSSLIKSGKLNKESVSHILFEYMDQGALSKRDVAKILSELKLI